MYFRQFIQSQTISVYKQSQDAMSSYAFPISYSQTNKIPIPYNIRNVSPNY